MHFEEGVGRRPCDERQACYRLNAGHESYWPNWHDIAKAQRGEYRGGVINTVKKPHMRNAKEFTESREILQGEITQAENPDLNTVQEQQAYDHNDDAAPMMMFRHRQLVTEKPQAFVMQGDAYHDGNHGHQNCNPVWKW